MPQLLFIDDEPHHLSMLMDILPEIIPDCSTHITENAKTSIEWLSSNHPTLIIMDIFLPLGTKTPDRLGTRSHQFEENLRHLGGLAILDFIEKMTPRPMVLTHTACTDFSLLEILGDVVHERIPKPASFEMMLEIIQRSLAIVSSDTVD